MLAFFAIAASRLRPAPPSVSCEGYLWTETVKRGTVPLDFRGTGMLVRARKPQRLIARRTVSDSRAGELRLNQETDVDMRKITLRGCVSYISPLSSNGMRSLDIAFPSPVPEGV